MLWAGCNVVHCGFWINWSKGAVYGSTLTLPTSWGLVLASVLALFLKLAGEHLWGIICFAIHQLNSTPKKQDDMYHQLQLILRNTESTATLISNSIKLGHGHKGARFETYRRSLLLVILGGFHTLAFYGAGTFSSYAITRNDEVRTRSRSCGLMADASQFLNITDDAIFESANSLLILAHNGWRKTSTYSRVCYSQSGGNSTVCNIYVRQAIPYNLTSVPCPFDPKICIGSGIELDPGLIHSDLHLGVNTRSEDRISVRKVLTCAPLAGDNYSDGLQPIPEDVILGVGYPPGTLWQGWKFGPSNWSEDTASEYTFAIDEPFYKNGDKAYNMIWKTKFLNKRTLTESPFEPIPELQSNNSDTIIVGLMNRMVFRTAVRDPWYNAQNCSNTTLVSALATGCKATNMLSWLGCQERYQFCTHNEEHCTPLTGLYTISKEVEILKALNKNQQAVFELLWQVIYGTQLNFQLGFVGLDSLIANEYLWDNGFGFRVSGKLPDNQWEIEIANWMNITLAAMQRSALSYARPPEFDVGPGISSLNHIRPPSTPEAQLLCHKIKARSKAHISFSVLGFFLTLSLGLLIIATDLALAKVVGALQKYSGKGLHKRLEWIENGFFQLQRMAAEGRGIGPWTRREKDVPMLVEYGHLFSLTGSSLKGEWSRAESYELGEMRRGMDDGDGDEEIMEGRVMGSSKVRGEEVEEDTTQLLRS
ncbi:hypothetical protein K469DRAFT_777276 [Zopfia rhizophila CBS 207.26]|uniref:Uncharacterized protein n=1 Tax=Zopfia rhizophila CBS 207.26 TaxID=1314779 RepID=A0A6A6E509_9PEZI|nr:hypothetical protein K469DRAFT_777276 [Zopfia rhizophila CBS 207.26]